MTLPDVLRAAIERVRRGEIVTIAQEPSRSYQVRFMPDSTIDRGYRVAGRRWVVDDRPGTQYEGWGHWSNFLGFSVDAAISDDWRVLRVRDHAKETP